MQRREEEQMTSTEIGGFHSLWNNKDNVHPERFLFTETQQCLFLPAYSKCGNGQASASLQLSQMLLPSMRSPNMLLALIYTGHFLRYLKSNAGVISWILLVD